MSEPGRALIPHPPVKPPGRRLTRAPSPLSAPRVAPRVRSACMKSVLCVCCCSFSLQASSLPSSSRMPIRSSQPSAASQSVSSSATEKAATPFGPSTRSTRLSGSCHAHRAAAAFLFARRHAAGAVRPAAPRAVVTARTATRARAHHVSSSMRAAAERLKKLWTPPRALL